jgi:uncharacterized iron-regulated membrane protein
VLFQVHLWSGIALGFYILMMSVTGSVLVYSNELYRAATPEPIISRSSGPRLTDDQLAEAAVHLYPGYRVVRITRARNLDQGVDVLLGRGDEIKHRQFDPRSGSDLGDSVPIGIWLVSKLLDLHDNLFAGPTGRKVNGVGALAMLAAAITGLAIWWPGINALPQHDRLLELWIHVGVWRQRGLPEYSPATSEPRRPVRATDCRECRVTHRRPNHLLARLLAFRSY